MEAWGGRLGPRAPAWHLVARGMELGDLLDALASPDAYGLSPEVEVEVVQTHISAVFLVGEDVYKLKKPVALEFLDYSTLEQRRHFCEREVELNRRLAPDVYLGVLPVVRRGEAIRVGGEGEVVDYVVHMRRLPDEAQLGRRVEAGEISPRGIEALGRRIARFHRDARRGDDVSAHARFSEFAGHCAQNLHYVEPLDFVSETLEARVVRAMDAALACARPAIERRAEALVPRDAHGDLRLDHVYLFPDRAPPDDLVIVDCIEFGDALRCVDPVSDLAFLSMDLRRVGRDDLAEALVASYFDELARLGPLGVVRPPEGDEIEEGRALLPLFEAYRASVRAKVDGLRARDPRFSLEARAEAERGVHRHLLLTLRALLPPAERPCLVLVAGLPGTGKSTLAGGLAEEGFDWVRSDVLRKRLFAEASQRGEETGPMYGSEFSDRTYAACLDEARATLLDGGRVVVDANFRSAARRAPFVALARGLSVPLVIFECVLDEATVRDRLERRVDDPSDADFDVYLAVRGEWEPIGEELTPVAIETSATPEEALAKAKRTLRGMGLA